MYEALHRYIQQRTPITDTEFESVRTAFAPMELKKRDLLLKEGEVCRYTAFVVSGALRMFHVDDKGNEHTTNFAIEDWWIGDRESFITGRPSNFTIEAVERSEVLAVTSTAMQLLNTEVPAFDRMMQTVKEMNAIAIQKRVVSALVDSAEKKYAEFVKNYPHIVQRFPQHMVASYLGITPETLSRLRKRSVLG